MEKMNLRISTIAIVGVLLVLSAVWLLCRDRFGNHAVEPNQPELSADAVSDSLRIRLNVLEKAGFASVAGARYVNVVFIRPEDVRYDAVSPIRKVPTVFSYGEYGITGRGWIRESPEGNVQTLVFDSNWWSDDRDSGVMILDKARLTRDIAKIRACLRHVADDSGYAASWCDKESDVYALAFTMHLLQDGRDEDAQSLYAELMRRPDAVKAAFATLWKSVTDSKREYPDFETWLKKSKDTTKESSDE